VHVLVERSQMAMFHALEIKEYPFDRRQRMTYAYQTVNPVAAASASMAGSAPRQTGCQSIPLVSGFRRDEV